MSNIDHDNLPVPGPSYLWAKDGHITIRTRLPDVFQRYPLVQDAKPDSVAIGVIEQAVHIEGWENPKPHRLHGPVPYLHKAGIHNEEDWHVVGHITDDEAAVLPAHFSCHIESRVRWRYINEEGGVLVDDDEYGPWVSNPRQRFHVNYTSEFDYQGYPVITIVGPEGRAYFEVHEPPPEPEIDLDFAAWLSTQHADIQEHYPQFDDTALAGQVGVDPDFIRQIKAGNQYADDMIQENLEVAIRGLREM